jgi:hypothetical protein
MQHTEIEHKKQSLMMTTALFVLFFLMLFYLSYNTQVLVPDLEGGGGGGEIAVNFGNSDVGSGDNFESMELTQPAPKSRQPEKVAEEALVTNVTDNAEAPVVAAVQKPKEAPKKPVEEPVEAPKPKPSKSATDALSNVLNSSGAKGGDGDDKEAGNKGKSYGDTKATGYNGGGGAGTGTGGGNGSGQGLGTGSGYGNGNGGGNGNGTGNYQLSGRKVISKPQPRYTCNEEGIVVVEISVNNAGTVIGATPGIKGTTNAAKCLADQAKLAAMNTKFDANPAAPDKQVGKIIYNFKLTQ